jgi:succinyl-CoA synthetase alpha subunit
MILRKHDRVLVQGITGKQGTFWTEKMQAYGTAIIGGVNPKKAGTVHCGVPVHGSAREAMAAETDAGRGFDCSVLFIPPLGVKTAALDAIEAGAKGLCILTEHIPVQDVMYVLAAARDNGTCILGPNTAGQVTPGECFIGFMPAFNQAVFRPGRVGVVSRSGSLGVLVCLGLVQAGLGISAFIGIGGDPVIGTHTREAVEMLDRFETTDAVVIVGEIGGAMEEAAADYVAGMKKPVAAFIAGAAAPAGKKMGHAGAIVSGGKGTYDAKRRALEEAGAVVLDTPADIGAVLQTRLG